MQIKKPGFKTEPFLIDRIRHSELVSESFSKYEMLNQALDESSVERSA